MVALQLQLPSTQSQPGILQEVDPIATLQQLSGLQTRPARVVSHQVERAPASRTRQLCDSLVSGKQHPAPAAAHTFSGHRRAYENDGVRLSELGDKPLATATTRAGDVEGGLSFRLSPGDNVALSNRSKSHFTACHDGHTERKPYICSIKDDPLVKGRLALQRLSLCCWCYSAGLCQH